MRTEFERVDKRTNRLQAIIQTERLVVPEPFDLLDQRRADDETVRVRAEPNGIGM